MISWIYEKSNDKSPRAEGPLDAHLPTQVSRVRVSVTPFGFHSGQNGVWVSFSRGFSRFPLPRISFHHFSTLISFISFHLCPCGGASGVVGRIPCYSQIVFNKEASSQLIPRPDPVLDTSWGSLINNLLLIINFSAMHLRHVGFEVDK